MDRVEKAAKAGECCFVVHGNVYTIEESYKDSHPGGHEVFQQAAGTDATAQWTEVRHSKGARRKMKEFLKGTLEGSAAPAGEENPTHPARLWPEEVAWKKKQDQKDSGYALYFALAVIVLLVALHFFQA